ncbi:catechol 1,2-dioxygenase [Algoriphagus namhaensis]|uniref:Catechol 1,2-dioxygenase n=1 Tax=Algoriphagus namhaensis TaxID=915353 RepID=A0ABV8APT7_9BACT
MKRRQFISAAALSVTAMSTFGFIKFDGEKYVGDCATTSDILGPFYRPGSPMRSNLHIPGEKGEKVTLSGKILHQDCTTPYKNAKVELWHCDATEVYDNTSDEFRYRGTVMTDDEGNYTFDTILPVPYDAGGGLIRPAHFHLMVTAEGYQSLITQLYFKGDENVAGDPWASRSTDRVLDVEKLADGSNKVIYNVGMAPTLAVETASLAKLIGTYQNETDPESTIELFDYENDLWIKNEAFGSKFSYRGNNVFESPNNPEGLEVYMTFEIISSNSIKFSIGRENGEKRTFIKKS